MIEEQYIYPYFIQRYMFLMKSSFKYLDTILFFFQVTGALRVW